MGKLIKNHWARLIVLTAGTYQILASIHGYIWPKIFWDYFTHNLDAAVKPIPILQTVNLVFGILTLCWEWPLSFIAGTAVHRSIAARLVIYPLSVLSAALMYQSTNAAIYLLIGLGAFFWAYADGEMVCKEPWTIPKRERPWPKGAQA